MLVAYSWVLIITIIDIIVLIFFIIISAFDNFILACRDSSSLFLLSASGRGGVSAAVQGQGIADEGMILGGFSHSYILSVQFSRILVSQSRFFTSEVV